MNALAGKTLTTTVYMAVLAQHLKHIEHGNDLDLLSVFSFDPSKNDPDWIVIETRSLSATLPADFDPIAPQVAALQAKKAQITAEFTRAVADLNRQLSELQAIEHSGATA